MEIVRVYDTKSWMMPCVPPLHDHLKAHQFKFETYDGSTRMFYKEWSTDDYWLPQVGMSMLVGCTLLKESLSYIPECSAPNLEHQPLARSPFFESEDLDKVETTIGKVAAYLEKSGANQWWRTWLNHARSSSKAEALPTEGLLLPTHAQTLYMYVLY
jgi:hypothetical protein